LKNESVDGVISLWKLPDAPAGKFLRNLRLAKPYLPIIALLIQKISNRKFLPGALASKLFLTTMSAMTF
jgi:hypothetical protein